MINPVLQRSKSALGNFLKDNYYKLLGFATIIGTSKSDYIMINFVAYFPSGSMYIFMSIYMGLGSFLMENAKDQ
jgi:hypothetical protein